MTLVFAFIAQLVHAALVFAAAPTLAGIVRRIEAWLAGRVGPPLLLPWQALARLLRKQPVMAESASEVSAVAPALSAAAVAIVALMVPSFTLGMTLAPCADLLVIAGLLALARCAVALAALDAGTALGGLGAARLMAAGGLAEPALALVVVALGLWAGSTNLDVVAALQQESGADWRTGIALALLAMVLMAVADEASDAQARPELAMRRAATALEFSGRDLALIDMTEALRRLVWLNLIVALFLPIGMAPAGAGPGALLVGLVAWAVKLLALAAVLALLHTATARMRLVRVPQALGVAVLLGLLAVMFLFAGMGAV